MSIECLLFDIGGVLLSPGWDHHSRAKAAEAFALDAGFEKRHAQVVDAFERGHLSLHDYLQRVVFDVPRPFSGESFVAFMHACSTPIAENLELLEELQAAQHYVLAVVSNESAELNADRFDRFGLRRYFSAFFSSCYLGLRKPEAPIFTTAINVLQKAPEACLMIDDREENIAAAAALGLRTLWLKEPNRLRQHLSELGVYP